MLRLRPAFHHKFLISAMAVLLFGCASLVAQVLPVPEPKTELSAIPGGSYEMDAAHASVTFEVTHMNFSTYVGRFNDLAATVDFKAGNPAASTLDVRIDPASIDTNNQVLEDKLRGGDFFDVKAHPELRYRSDRLEITGPDSGKLHGQLSMHGVTRPLVLDVTFRGGAKNPMTGKFTLGFSASGSLKRSDYGITYLVPLVADDVDIRIHAEFVKS